MKMTDRRKDLLRAIRAALDFSEKGRSILVTRVLLEAIVEELEGNHE